MQFFTASSIVFATMSSMTLAFAPSSSFTTSTYKAKSSQSTFLLPKKHEASSSSPLRLIPNPNLLSGDIVSSAASAVESSSIVTSDFIDSFVSNVGALFLIGSVGLGVYSGAMLEKEGVEESMEGTADDSVPLELSPKPVLKEVAKPVAEEVKEEPYIDPRTVTPVTNKKVIKDTEKAIAEVQKIGVQETKEKMNAKKTSSSSSSSSSSEKEETSKELAERLYGKNKTKKAIAKGATLVVAAGLVVVGKRLVQAWLGRGMI